MQPAKLASYDVGTLSPCQAQSFDTQFAWRARNMVCRLEMYEKNRKDFTVDHWKQEPLTPRGSPGCYILRCHTDNFMYAERSCVLSSHV